MYYSSTRTLWYAFEGFPFSMLSASLRPRTPLVLKRFMLRGPAAEDLLRLRFAVSKEGSQTVPPKWRDRV